MGPRRPPFSDDEFDAVILEDCLEFSADPEPVVNEAVRVCRGRVFVAVTNGLSLHRTPVGPAENFSRKDSGKARFSAPLESSGSSGDPSGDAGTLGQCALFPLFVVHGLVGCGRQDSDNPKPLRLLPGVRLSRGF